jgi:hypothetical protein
MKTQILHIGGEVMLTKESKIRVLENYYAIDYALFGKPISKMETCCPLVKEEYLSLKGALLSVYIEMLQLVEHSPKVLSEKVNSSKLISRGKTAATIARENARKIVTSSKSQQDIKGMLRETLSRDKDVDVAKLVEAKIREKAFSLAIDTLLVARIMKESNSISNLTTWEGKLLEDSYKILRDNLIESAVQILYGETD